MIWVIGDIHGMFDPLKRLLSMIQGWHYREDSDMRIDKLIFLGDYVDYGPSSKEVVDYIINLPFEKVCLMGNHDDLLLQFVNHSDLIESYGNVWFRGSGGQRTVHSFFPNVYYTDREERMSREEFPLDETYLNFFQNLKVTHTEQLGAWKLAFVHAIFNSEFPLEEQLAIKTYDDFHNWRRENKVWIENTLLWNREEPKKRFGDYILIHGHIPTKNLDGIWTDLHGYDTELDMPFLKFDTDIREASFYHEYSYRIGYTAQSDQLIAINADTGAVYGNRLTAIGISEDGLDHSGIKVYQVSVNTGYRLSEDFHSYDITFHGF